MLIQTEFPYPSANLRIPIRDKNIWIIITLKKIMSPKMPSQSSRITCLREKEKISSLVQLITTIRENLSPFTSIPESSRTG